MIEQMQEIPSAPYRVACHTEACENENVRIDVIAHPETPTVICGPCGQQITDVVPIPTTEEH